MQNQPQTKPLMLTSQASPTLLALEKWQPQNPAPATKDELSKAITALSEQMKPASDLQYAQAMKALIEFASAFQIPCQKPEILHQIYREQLGKLPGDLLMLAIDRVKAQWIWRTQMPFPADIRNKVSEEWSKRAMLLSRAKVAAMKATEPSQRPQIDPAKVAKHIKATTRQISADHSRRSSTADPDEMSHEEAAQQLEADKLKFNKQILMILDAG